MFTRIKKASPYEYLQIVENQWRDGKSCQRVIGTIGRVDRLRERGSIDQLLRSLGIQSGHYFFWRVHQIQTQMW